MNKLYRIKKTVMDIVFSFSEKHNLCFEKFRYFNGGSYHYVLLNNEFTKMAEVTLSTTEEKLKETIDRLHIKISVFKVTKGNSNIDENRYLEFKKELEKELSPMVATTIDLNIIWPGGKLKTLD